MGKLSLIKMSDDKKDKNDAESSTLKDVGWFALKTTAISGAVLGGTAAALPLIGFSGGGVVGGSLAAAYQSTFLGGTIVSGSVFASMQSAAVAGLAGSTQAAVVAGSAVVAGAHTALKKLKKNDETNSGHTSEESSENNKDDYVDEEPGGNDKAELPKKNCKDPGLKTGRTNSARENKKPTDKLDFSCRNDDPNITSSSINDDELDSLKKGIDVELNENLTITQHLIKK